jgi:hypothetical protein
MHLIGAGLPRTGTLTQKLALEQLGLGPCYHWVNLIADLDEVELWQRTFDGEQLWDEILGGYGATVDWPGGFFHRELAEAFPEAKVLLSVRDAEAWERSYRETIWEMCFGDSLIHHLSAARREVDPRWRRYLLLVDHLLWGERSPFAAGHETQQLIEQMLAYNEGVKRAVPSERLLVWEVGEGWGPLCEFLGVPVPDGPLPHENDRATFRERVTEGALATLQAWREERADLARNA